MTDLQVQISDTADDGDYTEVEGWANNYVSQGNLGGDIYRFGLRFQNVTAPQGSTVSSATITLVESAFGAIGSGPYGSIFGVLGNAPAWSSSNHPANQSNPTTASAEITAESPLVIDVTDVVQEILNGTWASGNSMAFFGDDSAIDTNIIDYVDYGTTPASAAILNITYTEASSGGTVRNQGLSLAIGLRL